jgi:hypothetical protein
MARQRQEQELAAAGALTTAGGTQQALDQRALDLARAEFERQQAYPQQQINAATATAGGLSGAVPSAVQEQGTQSAMVPGTNTGSQILGALSGINALTSGGFGNAITGALGSLF